MPALHFVTELRQCRRCISSGRASLHKTGSTRVWACWELLCLPSWGGSLVGMASPAALLTCSAYDHENEVEWKEELTGPLRTPEKALCVTQISTWELRSPLRYSRWLWLEFTTSSAAETQPNTSWLHFPARRTPLHNAEQHPHVPQLHSDLTTAFIFSSTAQEPQQDGTATRPGSRHPVSVGDEAGWCGDRGPMGQGGPCTAGPSS